MDKVRVLFLAANPPTTSKLALEAERSAIEEKIRSARHGELIELVAHWAVRLDDLSGLLMQYDPHVVHFSGHGSRDGKLILHHGSAAPRELEPATVDGASAAGQGWSLVAGLGHLFRVLNDRVKVVVLNACYSEALARSIVQSIACAVGTSGPIRDDHAIAFAAEFYQVLAYGRSVSKAYKTAMWRLEQEGCPKPAALVRLHPSRWLAARVYLVDPAPPGGPSPAPHAGTGAVAPPFWSVPHPRNFAFTGREDVLAVLREQLTANRRAVLSGLGGIGKTQTAVEYAYRHRDEYQAVLWLNAESTLTLKTAYATLAKELKLPGDLDDLDQAVAALRQWLKSEDGWLLILDNAEDVEALDPFLPDADRGQILLTSRGDDFQRLAILNRVDVDVLSVEDGTSFLLKRCGRLEADAAEQQAASELANALGGLPLALEQAAAYIVASHGATFKSYMDDYRRRGLGRLEAHGPALGEHPRSVHSTWQANFDAVRAKSEAAANVLQLSALLAPDAIPFELLAKGASELGPAIQTALAGVDESPLLFNDLLQPLARYSLIHIDAEHKHYSIHRLVQDVLKSAMDDATRRQWAARAVCALSQVFPVADYVDWPLCELLLPHALATASWIRKDHMETPEASRLLDQSAVFLYERAQYSASEPLLREALEIRRAKPGEGHPDYAASLKNLAELCRVTGRYAEAEPLFQKALEIRRATLGDLHPDYAVSLNSLGRLYWATAHFEKAEPLYKEALKVHRAALGDRLPDYAAALSNLAELYRATGHYEQAEPLYNEALEVRRAALGDRHPEYAASLNGLGRLYWTMKLYAKAEPLFKEAVDKFRSALGERHPRYATSLNYLAEDYRETSDYEKAEPLYNEAIEVRRASLGERHPDYAASLNGLAELFRSTGRYAEAEPLYRQALDILASSLGTEHPTYRTVLDNSLRNQEAGRAPRPKEPVPEDPAAGPGPPHDEAGEGGSG
jgi:tetratricopeptide (TPR) repeat protein